MEKVKVGINCYLAADILTNLVLYQTYEFFKMAEFD